MPIDKPNIFGRIITRRDVELAVVSFLQRWIPTYIGQMEKQSKLQPGTIPMPPDPVNSYRGGLDFNTWFPAWSPMYIVVVQPYGAPERIDAAGTYTQSFDLQVGCNFQMASYESLGEIEEDSARQYADMLGMAACAAILQHGGLGKWPDGTPVSTKTTLLQYPRTLFPFPSDETGRRVCRSQFSVRAVVSSVLVEAAGPSAPLFNPYVDVGDWPTVGSTGITIDAYPLNESVPSAPTDNT